MKTLKVIRLLAGMLIASPSLASEMTVSYDGVVSAIPDQSQAFDLNVGTPVYFSVTYDPSKLVNVSSTLYNIDAITGKPVNIPDLQAASLSDDPNAAFSVTVGEHSYTKTDDFDYGMAGILGVGDFPIAFVQNSQFVGVAFGAFSNDGFEVNFDPVSVALHYQPTYGVGGSFNSSDPSYGFLITPDLPAIYVLSAPEPSTWALMIVGIGGIGVLLRRAKRQTGHQFINAFAA